MMRARIHQLSTFEFATPTAPSHSNSLTADRAPHNLGLIWREKRAKHPLKKTPITERYLKVPRDSGSEEKNVVARRSTCIV